MTIEDEKKDQKCGKCKCYRFQRDFLKFGRVLKTCSVCRKYATIYRNKVKLAQNQPSATADTVETADTVDNF